MIESQHAMAARELAHDRAPELAEATQARDQDDGVAFAGAFEGEPWRRRGHRDHSGTIVKSAYDSSDWC
jgi:hypothetical protein